MRLLDTSRIEKAKRVSPCFPESSGGRKALPVCCPGRQITPLMIAVALQRVPRTLMNQDRDDPA
jgi:hypothetical protein